MALVFSVAIVLRSTRRTACPEAPGDPGPAPLARELAARRRRTLACPALLPVVRRHPGVDGEHPGRGDRACRLRVEPPPGLTRWGRPAHDPDRGESEISRRLWKL